MSVIVIRAVLVVLAVDTLTLQSRDYYSCNLDECVTATTHIVAHKVPSWIIATVIIGCTASALKK